MSRTACKFISLFVICALLLCSLAGCSEEEKAKNKFRQLFDSGIVIDNDITLNKLSDYTVINRSIDYFQIDGLKDQAVEDKINSRISQVIEEMRDSDFIPPYRGIAVRLKQVRQQNPDPVIKRSIACYAEFNSNNILTVSAGCYVYYYDQYDYFLMSYSYGVPMNFDLATGDELTLRDFFEPGTDYIELINRRVDECLMSTGYDGSQEMFGEYAHITAVSPFKTVQPDQKFIVTQNGDLSLFIDYDTPEFYTEQYFTYLSLSSESLGSVYTPYRVSEKTLSESGRKKCRFTVGYSDRNSERSENDGTEYGMCRYPGQTPDVVVKEIESLTFDSDRMPISQKELKKRAVKKLGTKKKLKFSRIVSTAAYPIKSTEYFSFIRQINMTAMPEDAWTPDNPDPAYYDASFNTSYCYDREGNRIDLYSIFNDSSKVDSLLEKAIPESIRRMSEENQTALDMTDGQALALVRQVIPHIDGAAPQSTDLSISYDLSDQELTEIISKILGNPETDYSVKAGLCTVAYSDLDYRSLVFFNAAFE